MTLQQVTSAIRAVNGEVVVFGPTSFGSIIRANVHGQSCRIITLLPNRRTKHIPAEPGTQTHVVSDSQAFQKWLDSLTKLSTISSSAVLLP